MPFGIDDEIKDYQTDDRQRHSQIRHEPARRALRKTEYKQTADKKPHGQRENDLYPQGDVNKVADRTDKYRYDTAN